MGDTGGGMARVVAAMCILHMSDELKMLKFCI